MADKKIDKQKLLSVGVTVVLVFFFVGGFWIGLDRVRSMEGTFPPNVIKEGGAPAPESVEQVWDYYIKSMDKAGKSPAHISTGISYDIGNLETDGSSQFTETVLFAKDNIQNHLSSVAEKTPGSEFGYESEKILGLLDIGSIDNIKEVKCSYIYYECPSCGLTSEEQLKECTPCGSKREYFKKYRPEYEVEFIIDAEIQKNSREVFERLFNPAEVEAVLQSINGFVDCKFSIENTEIAYKSLHVIFKVNRLTDELTNIRYIKNMSVSTDVEFSGEYEMLGVKKISFDFTECETFNLTWPSISLNNEILEIEPKGTDNLLATLTCEDPLAMTVVWTSSDETIATVDEDGYINTTSKTGEAVIIATYEYLGTTYSDSCTVYVKVPVESMKMSKKSIELGVGETFTLETKVSPKKATIQTVKWYSENEDIATVDENGVVTAVAKGIVIVYALSDDGYFRSTCEVTVE